MVFIKQLLALPGLLKCTLSSFMHWLLILNASTNFLIYCFMGKKFKTVLISLLRDFVKMKGQVNNGRFI